MRRSSWDVPDTEGRRSSPVRPAGQQATHPKLFGICALAVGDVDGATQGGDGDAELVIGTLNSDLVVIDLVVLSGVPTLGATRFWKVLDSSVGGCDAIRIDDLDPVVPGNEVYVATSGGLRRFVQQ